MQDCTIYVRKAWGSTGYDFLIIPAILANIFPGNIAKSLGVPDAKVKKAIQDPKIKPGAKKGVCNYYGKDIFAKVKAALK